MGYDRAPGRNATIQASMRLAGRGEGHAGSGWATWAALTANRFFSLSKGAVSLYGDYVRSQR
jgi:hypothetical protein